MKVSEALLTRHSTRAFLDKPVDEQLIRDILTIAGKAPSGANTQPWQVLVVSGERRQRLQARFEKAFRDGIRGNMDYVYYPGEWREPYTARRRECGKQLYDALGIERRDLQRRADQWAANYRAFDAPVMLLFVIDADLATGSYLDYGMFLQSIMLLAEEKGLATCAQAALAEYPDIVRDELNLQEDISIVAGMALGYEDTEAAVNSYRTTRESLESFVSFIN